MASIRSYMVPPPGGRYYFRHGQDTVTARSWPEMESAMRRYMASHPDVTGQIEDLVSGCMCPDMPPWYCRGAGPVRNPVRLREAWQNAGRYFSMAPVPFDTVSRRLRTCAACRGNHERGVCLTCTGYLQRIRQGFGASRVKVLEDDLSGMCACARTFEAVLASVEYPSDEPVWPGAPATCWRNTERSGA